MVKAKRLIQGFNGSILGRCLFAFCNNFIFLSLHPPSVNCLTQSLTFRFDCWCLEISASCFAPYLLPRALQSDQMTPYIWHALQLLTHLGKEEPKWAENLAQELGTMGQRWDLNPGSYDCETMPQCPTLLYYGKTRCGKLVPTYPLYFIHSFGTMRNDSINCSRQVSV